MAMVLLTAALLAVPADTMAQSESDKAGKNDKIVIVSDKLVTNNKEQFAEFTGNVKATQGDTVITADRLKIYYTAQNDKKSTDAPSDEESIQKIVASGNVSIKMDKREGQAQNAVYETGSGVLVLTGEGTRVASGGNYVTGEKITFYRNDDRMTVEGGAAPKGAAKKRVEAVFFPGKKGIK